MLQQPKRLRYRRPADGRKRTYCKRGYQLSKWITAHQIEAARVAVTRYMQREGNVWIRIFPHKPITRKPADVRMGKGKGDIAGYVAPVFPGRILIEIDGVSLEVAKEALRLAAQKLPIPTKFVIRHDYDPTQTV